MGSTPITRTPNLGEIMPFKSESQRKFLWAKHPEIAKKWAHKYGSKPQPKGEAIKRKLKRGS
jgi:hypothetical protein